MPAVKLVQWGPRRVELYKGIPQGGFAGHHKEAIKVLAQYLRPPAKVLDVGAWQGAFSRRLHDYGYDVDAVDLVPEAFRPKDQIECMRLDLNSYEDCLEFRERYSELYDAVIALEIVEHIRDPWRFIELCKQLLRAGGLLLLSTPNITSFYSRLTFLRLGEFHQFRPGDEIDPGHITPLNSRQLELIFSTLGLRILEKRPIGSLPVLWVQRDVKLMIKWALAAMLAPFMVGDKDGWCLLYLLEKDRPSV